MRVLELPFGTFELYTDIIVGKINDGVHFDLDCNHLLVSTVLEHYGTEHMLAYVSIRDNDYSVDPMVYAHNKMYENLACIGIVEKTKRSVSSVHLESKFFKKDRLKAFSDEEEAFVWSNKIVAASALGLGIDDIQFN